jgi:hypothetical protein
MKILGVSGSLRADSHNTALLRCAARHLPDGVELEVWDGLRDVPPYDEDDDVDPAPQAFAAFRAALAGADAVLFSTPEYNSSIPGQLKNAIDWLSRPVATTVLKNKPAAVVGASTGAFGAVSDSRKFLMEATRKQRSDSVVQVPAQPTPLFLACCDNQLPGQAGLAGGQHRMDGDRRLRAHPIEPAAFGG